METEAAAAGFYESPHHGQFPKLQILTIEGLMQGHERPRYPDIMAGAHTFKKARTEQAAGKQEPLFSQAEQGTSIAAEKPPADQPKKSGRGKHAPAK